MCVGGDARFLASCRELTALLYATVDFTIPIYLDACVKEAKRKQELLVHGGVAGDAQLDVVQLVVRALQVRLVSVVTIVTGLVSS